MVICHSYVSLPGGHGHWVNPIVKKILYFELSPPWHGYVLLLAYLLAFYLASIWHSIWHIFWHSIWPLRSSGARWAGKVPGWGPAVHAGLGRSQVEVQRCTLSWEGPRLRSSGAHWAGKVPGWGPAVHTELGRSQVEVRPAVHTELGRSQVEVQQCTLEKLEEEEEAEEEDEEEEEDNSPDKIYQPSPGRWRITKYILSDQHQGWNHPMALIPNWVIGDHELTHRFYGKLSVCFMHE